MGIPICLFAYGKLGMGIAAAISSLVVLLHFTLNIFLAKREFDLNVIVKSPSFYAIIATILFLYYEIPLPIFVLNTVMLLAYGNDCNDFNVSRRLSNTNESFHLRTLLLHTSTGRVIIGPLIGFALIFFNLSGFAAGVLLIQSSMPSAILCYLVASMYSPKEIVDNISSTIVVSTLMSLITVPITVFYALKYFN